MENQEAASLPEPTFQDFRPVVFAGLSRLFEESSASEIPALWKQFGPHIGNVPDEVGGATYGILYDHDRERNFSYLCAVEVSGTRLWPARRVYAARAAKEKIRRVLA